MHQFFLKIVPTQFDFLSGRYDLRTFQYSVNRQERSLVQQSGSAGGVPGKEEKSGESGVDEKGKEQTLLF